MRRREKAERARTAAEEARKAEAQRAPNAEAEEELASPGALAEAAMAHGRLLRLRDGRLCGMAGNGAAADWVDWVGYPSWPPRRRPPEPIALPR